MKIIKTNQRIRLERNLKYEREREREREMILHSFDSGYRKGKKNAIVKLISPLQLLKLVGYKTYKERSYLNLKIWRERKG